MRVAAIAAVLAAAIGVEAAPSQAAIISASDVAAGVTAPGSSSGPYDATATITNDGSADQSGSTLTLSASGGSVTGAPSGCTVSAGKALCTAGSLPSGASQSWHITVAPNLGAASVTATATVQASFVEVNILPDVSDNTASATTDVLYSLGVSGSSNPSAVRTGDDTLVTATVTNTGAPQDIQLTVNTGNVYDPSLALPAGCVASGDKTQVVCTNSYGPNESKSFDIAVTTLPSATETDTVLNAAGVGNTSSGSATVKTTENPNYAAFVPQGKSLAATEAKLLQNFTVVSGSAPGIFLNLDQASVPSGTMCGSTACNSYGAEALFPDSGTYSGSDPAHPFLWDINFGKLACNGNGTPKCTDILYYIPSGTTTPVHMLQCSTYGKTTAALSNVNQVCLQNAVKNSPGQWVFTVALLRDIVVPPIGGVVSAAP